MMSAIFIVTLLSLLIKHHSADKVFFGSTRGCDTACQKECIEVINKYRLNHRAKEVKFSQYLAEKAQKWADGGKFGYDMKSRGKYGQLIEWDVKGELPNFATVIKHWHDKEKDFDFNSGRSRTGKTLHDFIQIVWKKARKAGCGQSVIFGSKYYVVWMDSDGIVGPNVEVSAQNIGSPEKDDLHWYETVVDSPESKPTFVVPSRLKEESSSTRAVVKPKGPMVSITGKPRSDPNKPINSPDLNEVEEEQKVLNNNALLKQYLFHDNLNNVVLNENKETASYHVVPEADDKANWQKGAESLVQLDKNKSSTSKEKQPSGDVGIETISGGDEDDRKQATRFQSLVIQDDDMLTKDEGDDKEAISSEGNGGDEIGEVDDNKQAAAIQSMMKQEDDMIQHENDEENEQSSGNNSTVDTTLSPSNSNAKGSNNYTTSHSLSSSKQLRERPTSYYSSGVALSNNPNESASGGAKAKTSFNSTGNSLDGPVHDYRMNNQSSIDSSPSTSSLSNETDELSRATGPTDKESTTLLLQNDKSGGHVLSNLSPSQPVENKGKNDQKKVEKPETKIKGSSAEIGAINANLVTANNGGESIGLVSNPNMPISQNGIQMASKPQIGSIAAQEHLQSRVPEMMRIRVMGNQDEKSSDASQVQSPTIQSQQSSSSLMSPLSMPSTSGSRLKNQDSLRASSSFSQVHKPTEQVDVMTAKDSKGIEGSTSVSNVHQVSSPAVITLPNSSSRPIKFVFHVKDVKPKETSANALQTSSDGSQQSAIFANDDTQHMIDGECHDDTLQCHLWAQHGHCRGIAYAEFMKRHCKATCGYCSLPSIIKESATRLRKNSSLAQDDPCEDATSYEFSCPRWQTQGYCEKREEEMKLVCRKTCGFCEPSNEAKIGSSSFVQTSSPSSEDGVNKLNDKINTNVEVTAISQQPAASSPKPNLNSILKNAGKFTPSSGVQALGSARLTTNENSILGNSQRIPVSLKLKPLRPFGSSFINKNGNNNTHNTNEASVVSGQHFHHEQLLRTNGSKTLKDKGDEPDKALLNHPATEGLRNKTRTVDQEDLNTPSPSPRNFTKTKAADLTTLSASKAQVNSFFNVNYSPSQQSNLHNEDEVIANGIKALQNRLQAPLEISAVAKSSAGCRLWLCKEKVKTQQAKTRGNIGNQGSGVSFVVKTESIVATKGCDAACQQECLAAHNRYRLNHDAPPLILDQTLANQAQQWADKKVFKHSPWAGGQGGETIALGSLYPSFTAAVKAWHDEEKDYNWSTGTGEGGMKISHFTQVVWKRAHLLGCGKTLVNGEPYYIAQMDTPGVIADVPGFDKSNVGQPKEPDLHWFMDSSPYWKEMQAKDSIPNNIEHRIL